MEFKENVTVYTGDDEKAGSVDRVVIDPRTREVTHIVVRKGWLFPEDKLVPIELVSSTSEDRVTLSESLEHIEDLPPFEESYYVEADQSNVIHGGMDAYAPPALYWYPMYTGTGFSYPGYPGYAGPPTQIETERNTPPGTVSLKEGARVVSSDDEHVGDVSRVLVDNSTGEATHLVISQGLILKSEKTVPILWVESASEDEVRLAVSSTFISHLPKIDE